jgi:hypothetical protein
MLTTMGAYRLTTLTTGVSRALIRVQALVNRAMASKTEMPMRWVIFI